MTELFFLIERTSLLERLLGVGLYVALLLIVCLAINQTKKSRQIYSVLFFYQIALTIVAFFFVYDSDHDLSRLIAIVDSLKNVSLESFISGTLLHTSSPVAYILYFIVAKLGVDGLLPASAAFVFYGCSFYVIGKTAHLFNLKNGHVSLCLLFFMCSGTFLEVISDVRNLVAFSIIAWCVFREMVEGKSVLLSIPFYLIALLLHLAAFPLIAMRFIFYVFSEADSFWLKFGSVSLIVISLALLSVFASSLLNQVYTKAISYLTVKHYSYFWEYLAGGLKYLLCLYIWIMYKRSSRAHDGCCVSTVARFAAFVWVVGVCLCFEYSIFHRFMVPMMLLFVPVLGVTLERMRERGDVRFQNNVFAVSIFILLLACARGDLCGYRFIEL